MPAHDPPTEPVDTDPTNTDPGDHRPPADRPQGFAPGSSSFFGDCPALLGYMQTEATERVTAWGLRRRLLPLADA